MFTKLVRNQIPVATGGKSRALVLGSFNGFHQGHNQLLLALKAYKKKNPQSLYNCGFFLPTSKNSN
ncbi:MAG: hypothetical protein R3A13_09770 [Bdellovibrionota bacterium]